MSDASKPDQSPLPPGQYPAQGPQAAQPGQPATAAERREAALEAEMGTYPLRPHSQDPMWASIIVWIWVSFAVFCIVFIVVLLVLGSIYD